MDSENVELEWSTITGDISVEHVTRIPHDAFVYIIMGPTGAGKSTFIEALAGESQKLAISSNQLAGFTQNVTAYKLVNVERKYSNRVIYLIDTPGFSDDKISEIEVMEMLRDWLKENCSAIAYHIFFLTPITVTRLPGSRRRTIDMLRESLGGKTYKVTIITTMWDTLHNQRTLDRAEKNFEQLRGDVFKKFFGKQKTNLTRFMGTRSSALQVMEDKPWDVQPFKLSTHMSSTHLYRDLHERIQGALQRKVILESDLAHSDAQTIKILKDILERDQKENDKILTKFISQLIKFGEPPQEFQEAAQALRKTIAANITPTDYQMRHHFRQWAKEPVIRSRPGFDTEPNPPISGSELETMIAEQAASTDLVHHRPSTKLDINGLLGHVVDFSKVYNPKWFKRRE